MAKSSESTKQALFSATLELIGEKGFTGTTVDEIVERAGVAKGTVYYHFKSKAELVEALIAQYLAPLEEMFRDAAKPAHTPAEKIEAIVRAELRFIHDNQQFSKLLITEMWREDRVWRETLGLLRQDAVGVLREAIEQGMASGDFASDLDPALAASALFGMVAVTALDWLMLQPERAMEDVARHVCPLAISALLAR